MMEFIMTTLSITVGILLASVIAFIVTLQPRVWRWYTKKVYKLTELSMTEFLDEETKDL